MKKSLLFILVLTAASSLKGQTWMQQNSNSTNDFNTIFATNDNRAHAFGDSTDIFGGFALGSHYLSTNQGFSWGYIPLNSIVYTSNESYFVNDNVGYLVGKNQLSGNGFILKTSNGGTSWTEGVPHVERLEAVHFENANVGYAAGRNDYVVRTVDGGANWVDVSSNTGDHILGVSFTNPENGYIVGRAGNIAHTVDSASTWVNQNSNTNEDLEAVWFVNDSTGWAVGTAGAIVFTSDSGTTWVNQTSGTPEDLLDVEFVNDTTGWAVGLAGTVLITTDAGATWSAQNSNTNEDIFSITMRNNQLGWFCGTNGAIYLYAVTAPNSITEVNSNIETSVYPNPFDNTTTLTIKGSNNNLPVTVNILDMNGRIVRSYWTISNGAIIEKGNLNSGIYLLQISNESAISTQKLIIK